MKSYHEYNTEKECLQELERAKKYPHPFGLKINLSCKQMSIQEK